MRRLTIPALVALGALAGCQQQTAPASDADTPGAPGEQAQMVIPEQKQETRPVPMAMTDIETAKKLARGNNLFAWSLYDALDGKPGNVFVSPASVSGAFALLYPGAAGGTADHMATLFGYDAVPREVFPAAVRTLSEAVVSNTDTAKLAIANAVWLRQGSTLQAPYRAAVEDVMKAKVALVDFTQPAAAARLINDWVEARTNNKIKNLIPASAIKPQATELVLTNAVWFKADWRRPFKAESTSDGPFYTPEGKITAQLMNQTLKKARYQSGDGFAALDLDYMGDDYALTVILPDAQDGLADVASAMTPETFTALLADMDTAAERRVHVVLPKVKIEADYQLNDVMIGLGLGNAFTADADFSSLIEGAGPGDLVISQVLHKTFLEIDEKGTEAAAATAIVMERAAIMVPEEEPVEFRADHPFLIALRHKPTGTVMFIGRVEAPAAAE
jgi:serine protease inhibitor